MKKYFFLIIFSLFIASGVSAAVCADHDFSGYAWSSNIGWISFSCPVVDSGIDYGVDLDEGTGLISGYGWSSNIGWISFESGDLSGCPSGACEARLDADTGNIDGWARALAPVGQPESETGGFDGWISLSGNNYQANVDYAPNPSELTDWAWGSDVVGWVSFNCSNTGTCGTSDYKVTVDYNNNNAPGATGLNESSGEYCFVSAPPMILNWTFTDSDSGDSQSAYQIQVDDNAGFPSPLIDTGKVSSASSSYAPSGLSFNTTYYWQVRVWDQSDEPSVWSSASFATDPRWPEPGFTYLPENPLAEEEITFSNSTSYCTGCSYLWDFDDGNNSSDADPVHEYQDQGNYSVKLTATSGPRSCNWSDNVDVGAALPLPVWNEIAPF